MDAAVEHPRWPYETLDVPGLRRSGWRPSPFREFVVKVHQRCNLACDYCYVYTMADDSWRRRPKVITPEVWRASARRIGEHAATHGLESVRVILHGGEPLLAGVDLLTRLADEVRAAQPAGTRTEIGLQSNGVLLTEPVLRALHAGGISVGVSLDGGVADHDRRRRRTDGRGSHSAVHRALTLLRGDRYRSAYAGLLCTIDTRSDPVECYEELLAHEPPAVDFLLPHANWVVPPAVRDRAYGEWLIAVFDRWYDAPRQETRVRLFEDILDLILGGTSRSEQVGLAPARMVVIETDGSVEQVDSLKSAYAGAAATGLSVFTDPLDGALAHPGVVARQIGAAALCETCLRCRLHRVCGAGHYAHRYRSGTGFRNPSVYCADLSALIRHVAARIGADLRVTVACGSTDPPA